MKPRSIWTGYLKISLVTIPVRVYTALNPAAGIAFHQLHKECHQRLRHQLVCPVHGAVPREDLVKGYEYAPDKYIVVKETDLEQVRLDTTRAIELVQFIASKELDALYLDTPYYIGPDGPVAEAGFGVLREALRRSNRIGLGRVVLAGKEKLVALEPVGPGLVLFTLRYGAEVRPAAAYFGDLADQPVEESQVALAQQLIEHKSAPLDLAQFADRYQTALRDLIKGKINGTEPILVPHPEAGQVINLLEALRQSVAQSEPNPAPARKIERKLRRKKLALAA